MRSDVQAERQELEILRMWWNILEKAAAVDTGERSSNAYSSGGWGRAASLGQNLDTESLSPKASTAWVKVRRNRCLHPSRAGVLSDGCHRR